MENVKGFVKILISAHVYILSFRNSIIILQYITVLYCTACKFLFCPPGGVIVVGAGYYSTTIKLKENVNRGCFFLKML